TSVYIRAGQTPLDLVGAPGKLAHAAPDLRRVARGTRVGALHDEVRHPPDGSDRDRSVGERRVEPAPGAQVGGDEARTDRRDLHEAVREPRPRGGLDVDAMEAPFGKRDPSDETGDVALPGDLEDIERIP